MTDLAEGIERIARVIGHELALRLADRFGGIPTYVPRNAKPEHPWAQLIGLDAWAAIVQAWPSTTLVIPLDAYRGVKKAAVLELVGQGLSAREIAMRTRTTVRYVQQLLAATRGDSEPQKKSSRKRTRRVHPEQTRMEFDS